MRLIVVAGVAVVVAALAGCSGGTSTAGSSSSSASPTQTVPAALEWVQAGYMGNPWLSHVSGASWQGDRLVVATDLAADATGRSAATAACTAFHAYQIRVKRQSGVQVTGSKDASLATC